MEEAYSELYQQFLRLRSLCLRQAALLHQLTATLQQGATVPNGELSDMMSIPVQCTQEFLAYFHEKPQPPTATAHNPAAQYGVDCQSKNVGTFSDLLAEDMSKLCVDGPHHRKENREWQGASANVSKNLLQAVHRSGDRTMHTARMPVTDSPSLAGNVRGQCDGLLMSDVALQSHVCEFCQAVFPGDTTTRGEFLRHLTTHVT